MYGGREAEVRAAVDIYVDVRERIDRGVADW